MPSLIAMTLTLVQCKSHLLHSLKAGPESVTMRQSILALRCCDSLKHPICGDDKKRVYGQEEPQQALRWSPCWTHSCKSILLDDRIQHRSPLIF
jgi:hypothetical protein